MERRRLQQQRLKQQQQHRFCVSQQDITQSLAQIKPQRRATHSNLLNTSSISSLSTCSIEPLTIPSVSQLIKEFEARTVSTPYECVQDFVSNNNVVAESNNCSDRTINTMVNDEFIENKEPIYQTIVRQKQDLSLQSDENMSIRDKTFSEIRAKEVQLNNALADLISLSNDADMSSSRSSRSMTNNSQHRRSSSVNDNTNSISTSIALLNNLIETFDLNIVKNKNEPVKPINMFW